LRDRKKLVPDENASLFLLFQFVGLGKSVHSLQFTKCCNSLQNIWYIKGMHLCRLVRSSQLYPFEIQRQE
jgi:hypothetical protein